LYIIDIIVTIVSGVQVYWATCWWTQLTLNSQDRWVIWN